jgi:hypothetical protein
MNREDWFLERIGKRVFRTQNGCTCESCLRTYHDGIIIMDKEHAHTMFVAESEYQYNGLRMIYFDSKHDVEEYERNVDNVIGNY